MQTRGSLAVAAVATACTAVAVAEAAEEQSAIRARKEVTLDQLRSALIELLEAQAQNTAADLLARGEWKLEDNQLSLRLPLSEKVIDLSLSTEVRRLLTQEASRLCGRPIKLKVAGGGVAQAPAARVSNGSGNQNGNGAGGARQRAAEDPVVQRMQEKFGAEVRTVVDLRKK